MDAAPASQQPWMAVTSARLVGPRMATWSPGAMPRAWRAAATAQASSWSWPTGRCRRRRTEPTKVTVGRRGALEPADDGRGEACGRTPGTGAARDAGTRTAGHPRRGRQETGGCGPVIADRQVHRRCRGTERRRHGDRRPRAPLHRRAGGRDRAPLAGPVGRRAHLRGAQPGRPPGRARRGSPAGPKLFILDMFPYPSGAGLHVGHPLGYIGTDVYGRYQADDRATTCCTPWATTPSACRPSSTPSQTGTHPRSPPRRTSPTTAASCAGWAWPTTPAAASPPPTRPTTAGRSGSSCRSSNAWYDADADRARPIAELLDEFDGRRPARRPTAAVGGSSPLRAAPRRRRPPPGLPRRGRRSTGARGWARCWPTRRSPPTGRSDRGNFPVFRRNLRQWMMRITAYADRLHRRPRPPRLARPDQDDAAQLDRPLRGRPVSTSRRRRRAHRGVHHPARHPVRRHVHGAGARAPPGRRPDRRRLARAALRPRGPAAPPPRREAIAAYRAGGRGQDRPGAPGRGPGQDRRVHRRRSPSTRPTASRSRSSSPTTC